MRSGVAWISIAAALSQAATLIAGILVANAIGAQRFGTYSFLQSTLMTWSQAAALSSGLLASRYLAAYGKTDAKIAGEIIGYCTAMTAVAGSLGGVLLFISRRYLMRNVSDAASLGSMPMGRTLSTSSQMATKLASKSSRAGTYSAVAFVEVLDDPGGGRRAKSAVPSARPEETRSRRTA